MFSLKSLLFIVAVAGLGAAGLIHRTQLWASALVALTLGVLLLAVCRAWFSPQGRTFWGPFALTGAVYLAIVSLPPLVELHYNLPTTQLVVYAMEKMQTPASPAPVPYGNPAYGGGYAPVYYPAAPSVNAAPPAPATTAFGPANGLTISYAAPLPVQSITYNRETLFAMATTMRIAGAGFASEVRPFLWVAQCLWCLLLAFGMGLVSSWLFRGVKAAAG